MEEAASELIIAIGPDVQGWARFVALAGALAERGVTALRLVGPAGVIEVRARDTDLPGLLARCAPCRLEFQVGGLTHYVDVTLPVQATEHARATRAGRTDRAGGADGADGREGEAPGQGQ